MKLLIMLAVGLLAVGCLTPEQKQKRLRDSVVGTYERNDDGDGSTVKADIAGAVRAAIVIMATVYRGVSINIGPVVEEAYTRERYVLGTYVWSNQSAFRLSPTARSVHHGPYPK